MKEMGFRDRNMRHHRYEYANEFKAPGLNACPQPIAHQRRIRLHHAPLGGGHATIEPKNAPKTPSNAGKPRRNQEKRQKPAKTAAKIPRIHPFAAAKTIARRTLSCEKLSPQAGILKTLPSRLVGYRLGKCGCRRAFRNRLHRRKTLARTNVLAISPMCDQMITPFAEHYASISHIRGGKGSEAGFEFGI
ncbi:hypothetical protein [Mesorhizobium sp. A556]